MQLSILTETIKIKLTLGEFQSTVLKGLSLPPTKKRKVAGREIEKKKQYKLNIFIDLK